MIDASEVAGVRGIKWIVTAMTIRTVKLKRDSTQENDKTVILRMRIRPEDRVAILAME